VPGAASKDALDFFFQYMRKGGSLDRAMGRDGQLKRFRGSTFLKPNMAPFLSHHNPPIPLQSSNNLIVWEAGDFRHTAISIISASGA